MMDSPPFAVCLPCFNGEMCSCVGSPSMPRTPSSVHTLWAGGRRCLHVGYFCFEIVLSVYLRLGVVGGEGGECGCGIINEEMTGMSAHREQSRLPAPTFQHPQTGRSLLIGCWQWKTGRTSDDRSHPVPDCRAG